MRPPTARSHRCSDCRWSWRRTVHVMISTFVDQSGFADAGFDPDDADLSGSNAATDTLEEVANLGSLQVGAASLAGAPRAVALHDLRRHQRGRPPPGSGDGHAASVCSSSAIGVAVVPHRRADGAIVGCAPPTRGSGLVFCAAVDAAPYRDQHAAAGDRHPPCAARRHRRRPATARPGTRWGRSSGAASPTPRQPGGALVRFALAGAAAVARHRRRWPAERVGDRLRPRSVRRDRRRRRRRRSRRRRPHQRPGAGRRHASARRADALLRRRRDGRVLPHAPRPRQPRRRARGDRAAPASSPTPAPASRHDVLRRRPASHISIDPATLAGPGARGLLDGRRVRRDRRRRPHDVVGRDAATAATSRRASSRRRRRGTSPRARRPARSRCSTCCRTRRRPPSTRRSATCGRSACRRSRRPTRCRRAAGRRSSSMPRAPSWRAPTCRR